MTLRNLLWNWDPWRGHRGSYGQSYPPINVYESTDAYGIEVRVPGVDPEKLDVKVEGDLVAVSGERTRDGEDEGSHRQERPLGSFSRMLRLPARLDAEAVEAHYVDGVLALKLPKAPEAKARKINVRGG